MSSSRRLESPFLRGPRLAQAPERPLHVLEPLRGARRGRGTVSISTTQLKNQVLGAAGCPGRRSHGSVW